MSTATAAGRRSPAARWPSTAPAQPRSVERSLSIGPATLEVSGAVADSRNIALTAPSATISVDASQSYNNSGTISGNGGLTVSGQGLLGLYGANSYSGTTTVSAGTLELGNANALQNMRCGQCGGCAGLRHERPDLQRGRASGQQQYCPARRQRRSDMAERRQQQRLHDLRRQLERSRGWSRRAAACSR